MSRYLLAYVSSMNMKDTEPDSVWQGQEGHNVEYSAAEAEF